MLSAAKHLLLRGSSVSGAIPDGRAEAA